MSVTRLEISAQDALGLASKAIEHARAHGWEITVAVCDPRGDLVAFLRTDDVVPPAIGFALDKAYTAATLRKSSQAFGERMASSASLSLGLGTRDRLLSWAGGVPIFENGVCIGGIGVSGAQDHQDVACAEAAISASGYSPEA